MVFNPSACCPTFPLLYPFKCIPTFKTQCFCKHCVFSTLLPKNPDLRDAFSQTEINSWGWQCHGELAASLRIVPMLFLQVICLFLSSVRDLVYESQLRILSTSSVPKKWRTPGKRFPEWRRKKNLNSHPKHTPARRLKTAAPILVWEQTNNYQSNRIFLSDLPSPPVFGLKPADKEINIPKKHPASH